MAAAYGTATVVKILSAAAVGEVVRDLGGAYEAATGVELSAEFTRSPLVRDRIRAGEVVDVVITTQSRIEELAKENRVVSDSTAILARSGIGVAVRAGRPKPDIGSVEAFIRALRAANSIACADPAFGTASGLYMVELFERLGLTAELKPKLRLIGAADGKAVVVCAAVADGSADLGIQQIAEIVAVPNVDLVGPLPPEIQHTTAFAVAVATTAKTPDLARNFVRFITSQAARSAIGAAGMEPG